MSTCPSCQHPATKRDGYTAGRQRYHCRPCQRDFTANSTSAFSGYRWPPDVILMAVRWYCSLPLSAAQVVRLLLDFGQLSGEGEIGEQEIKDLPR
jgi:transposase-like protein